MSWATSYVSAAVKPRALSLSLCLHVYVCCVPGFYLERVGDLLGRGGGPQAQQRIHDRVRRQAEPAPAALGLFFLLLFLHGLLLLLLAAVAVAVRVSQRRRGRRTGLGLRRAHPCTPALLPHHTHKTQRKIHASGLALVAVHDAKQIHACQPKHLTLALCI
jgi:hypothetical protein